MTPPQPGALELTSGVTARDVIDSLARAIIACDPDGTILLWSASAEQLYGWGEDEVLGRSLFDVLTPPSNRPDSEKVWEALRRGEPFSADRTALRRDGRPVRVLVVARPIRDGDGTVRAVAVASEDISDARLAERQLNDLNDHLRTALEAGGLGTWRWDLATGVTTWDDRLHRLFGRRPGEFDGTYEGWLEAVHADDREAASAQVERAVAERRGYRVEHRVVWPDGSVHWLGGSGAVVVDDDGEVTGTIGCLSDITDAVEARESRQRAAADAMALAEQERIYRERYEFLNEVHLALADAVDQRDVMRRAVNAAVPRLGDWAIIHVVTGPGHSLPVVELAHVDRDEVEYVGALRERFPYDPEATTGVAAVIRTGRPELVPDVGEYLLEQIDAVPDEAVEAVRRLRLGSGLTVPVRKRGRTLGALQLINTTERRRFTEEDLDLARMVASRVAASLENRRLYEEQARIATTLQQSLLPGALPAIDGLDLAVRYWAAVETTEVGGDFYDVFKAGPSTWGAVIGDVCGKGAQAAALTGLARHSIRMSAWNGNDPVETIGWLNRAVREAGTRSYLTACYLTLRPAGSAFAVTAATGGHPHPIVARAGGPAEVVPCRGTLLGPYEDVTCHPAHVTLEPGDTLVLYTDGITDLSPPHDLTEDEVVAMVADACRSGSTADEVADRLHDAVEEILPIDERADDIALLVMTART